MINLASYGLVGWCGNDPIFWPKIDPSDFGVLGGGRPIINGEPNPVLAKELVNTLDAFDTGALQFGADEMSF